MTRYEYVKTVLEPRFKDEDELYHHGILGMKWGVRRYQNEDGSLTEEGKQRYGESLHKDLIKADKKKGAKGINDIARNNKVLRQYYKDSETRKMMDKAAMDNQMRAQQLSDEVNRTLMKEPGADPMSFEYLIKGAALMGEMSENDEIMNKTKKDYDRLSKQYEKETRQFIEDLLGDGANTESVDKMAIKYNKETNKVSQQTLADRLTMEMLRNAGIEL